MLLVYLKRYLELLIAFDKMDASHDRQLEPGEIEAALRSPSPSPSPSPFTLNLHPSLFTHPLTSHPSPLTSHLLPLTSHFSPSPSSHPSPLTSHPSPLTSHLSPLTSHPHPGEFEGALHLLASWGVSVVDPAFEFSKIDTDGSGAVPFDEFCTWALSQGLDLHPLDAVTDEGGGDVSRPQKSSSEVAVTLRKERAARKAKEEKARIAAMTGHGDATHAWMEKHSLKEMLSKLPIKDTKADEAERIKMFSGADTNGNGFLSLFEVRDLASLALTRLG